MLLGFSNLSHLSWALNVRWGQKKTWSLQAQADMPTPFGIQIKVIFLWSTIGNASFQDDFPHTRQIVLLVFGNKGMA